MSTSDDKGDVSDSEREILQKKLDGFLNRELSWEDITQLLQIAQCAIQISIHDLSESGPRLVKYGWYPVAAQLPDMPRLMELIESGRLEELDRRLVEMIEGNLNEIEWTITQSAPTRRLPIEESFEAHRNGKYYLSIPVLLAQAEGICIDNFNEKLFATKDGKSRISSVIPKLNELNPQYDYQLSSMSLLAILGPINSPEGCVQDFGVDFNRHKILHGKSTDYGTRINSCKAISLLVYVMRVVSTVFPRIMREDSNGNIQLLVPRGLRDQARTQQSMGPP